MLTALKSLLRLVFYIPLRLLRFAAKLAVLGCVVWVLTDETLTWTSLAAWLIAASVAYLVLSADELILRWLGPPRLL